MSIHFENVSKDFGDVRALRHVTLDVADGEVVFLLGPSGCGKTTLLRCLAGFEEPTEGRILMNGQDLKGVPTHRRNTAMVFQGYALWPHMTVAQNVAFGLEVQGRPRAEREERVQRALAVVRIQALAARKPNELSGGQQQRVALARTLALEPACLLLDEPLANLDAKLRRDMRSEIRRICKENGLTAVYVTHDREEALSMADRIAVLRDGVLLQVGAPRDLYTRPRSAFVASFIGETNFVEATILDRIGGCTSLDALFGRLVSAASGPDLPLGSAVQLSLRPEALRWGRTDPNTFTGRLRETTYLGELAEHTIEISQTVSLKVFELNPRQATAPGTQVSLCIDPEDVVVLPPEGR
jgi:ABC-type Fe3+/spermidine/putrescine transport system ATPase subunit